jgi:hypothetical protein
MKRADTVSGVINGIVRTTYHAPNGALTPGLRRTIRGRL